MFGVDFHGHEEEALELLMQFMDVKREEWNHKWRSKGAGSKARTGIEEFYNF